MPPASSILTVGPGQQYTTVAAAVAAAGNGDTIDIEAGTYTNDFATIPKSLVIQAVGGPVVEQSTEPTPNGKAIWDVGGTSVTDTITGIEFTGAEVTPQGGNGNNNGAGIRTEGGTLTLNDDYFYANQEGLLAAPDPNGILTINDSEFADNGYGDGYTHNLYVDQIATLDIDDSYFHDAIAGHEIKSRALNTIIENSRIQDQNGTASYVIDLPNGGNALIQNDTIQKGPNAQNPAIISYGEESNLNPGSLVIAGNTIINDLTSHAPIGVQNDTGTAATITNNQIYDVTPSQLVNGPANVSGNTYLTSEPTLDTTSAWSQPASGNTFYVLDGQTLRTEFGTDNTVYMGDGAEGVLSFGTDTIYAGTGSDTISATAGNSLTVVGGTGNLTFQGGRGLSGSGTADITLQGGTTNELRLHADRATVNVAGDNTIGCGSSSIGADILNFTSGDVGTDLVSYFHPGTDYLQLTGFASGVEQTVIDGVVQTSAGAMLTLPDGTQITLAGISQVTTAFLA